MTLSFRVYIAAICGLALFQGACAPDSAAGRPRGFDEVVFGRGEAEDPARQAAIDAGFLRCLYHELGHIMGLTYHPGDLYSILDHASNTDGLTSADWQLLALLYDRRLVPGMARRQALRAARGVLSGRGADRKLPLTNRIQGLHRVKRPV